MVWTPDGPAGGGGPTASVLLIEDNAAHAELVTRSFEQEARRTQEDPSPPNPVPRLGTADRKALATVASILHRWTPPRWLDTWGKGKQG